MKPPNFTRLLAAVWALLVASNFTYGANQTWSGNVTNGNWSSGGAGGNWGGAALPGATNTATFNSAIANTWGDSSSNPIVLTADTSIKSLTFTGATGSYFIGSTGGPKFVLTSGGALTITNNVTLIASNATITVNAPIMIENAAGTGSGTYSFVNNSENGTGAGTATLNVGGAISGNATTGNTTVLTIKGNANVANRTNYNTISGVISDGTGGGNLDLNVGSGLTVTYWKLTGNNQFTGNVTIISGGSFLSVASDSNLGLGSHIEVQQNSKFKTTSSFATSKDLILQGGNPHIQVALARR